MKISLIEDHSGGADWVTTQLHKIGNYHIQKVDPSPKALAAIQAFEPELILMVLHTTDDAALSTLRELRKPGAGPLASCPVIVCSPFADPKLLRATTELAIQGFIILPATVRELSQRIASAAQSGIRTPAVATPSQ